MRVRYARASRKDQRLEPQRDTILLLGTAGNSAIVVALGALLLWRLARERTALIALLSAVILLLAAHLSHLLLFQLL